MPGARAVAVGAGLFLGLAAAAWPESTPQILARLDQTARSFTGAKAGVRIVSHNFVADVDESESGTIVIRRSGPGALQFLLSIDSPNAYAVALRDKTVDRYTPKTNSIQPYDLRKYRDLVQQLMLLGFGMAGAELAANYEIRDLGADAVGLQNATRLELVPKSPDVLKRLKKVELWFAEAASYPVQQKFDTGGGDYRVVTYSGVKINPALPASALDLPKGAKREPAQ